MKRIVFLWLMLMAQPVLASALFDQTNANYWLVESNGHVTSYNHGSWLEQFNNTVYPISVGEQVLINTVPASSTPLSSQLSPMSLNGLGEASRVTGQTGGDRLLIEPASGDYQETIEVVISADAVLLDSHTALTLTWQINGGAASLKVFNDPAEAINDFFEANLFLVNNIIHNLHVELLDTNGEILSSMNRVYDLRGIDSDDATRTRDSDLDGLPDIVELAIGLNPLKDDWQTDSDNDGWSDFDVWLRSASIDPQTGKPVDSDSDGWSDFDEELRLTNPNDLIEELTTANSAHPAPLPNTLQYNDTLLSFKERPVVQPQRLYAVEYKFSATKLPDSYLWNASASSHSLLGLKQFDSDDLLSNDDLAWAGLEPVEDSLKQATFDARLQQDQVAEFRLAASTTQVIDVIANETIVINAGTENEVQELRRWHYKTVLSSSPDLTPDRFIPALPWATADDWKQQYIAFLTDNLVLNRVHILSLDQNIYVEALQLLLADEIKLQGGNGVLSWDSMNSAHQQMIRQLQEDISNRENGRSLYQVYIDLRTMLDSNGLTQSYNWLQSQQPAANEAVDVSNWLQQQAMESTSAEMIQFKYQGRLALFTDGASQRLAFPDLANAVNDTDTDGIANEVEVGVPFSVATYPWALDTDGDLVNDSQDTCPVGDDKDCDADVLLHISATVNIDEPLSGENQDLLIGFQLNRTYHQDVSFTYTVTASGTDSATPNVDFTPISGMLVIRAGQRVVHIAVPILADSDFSEGNESFHVELSDVTNATIPDSSLVFLVAPATYTQSTNAQLANLSASTGTLNPVFNSSTLNYATTVANSVSALSVIPTTANVGATVTVNGVPVISGSASAALNLNVGDNTVTVAVTAEDGSTINTYSIIVTREALSNDASLSALILFAASLDQVLQAGLFDYTARVDYTVSTTTVTVTSSDVNATVTVNGLSVTSGSPSDSISLTEGANIIDVLVTAEDNSTQAYQITISRQSADIFAQQAYIKASSPGLSDYFGFKVAISGDTLAVSAYKENSNAVGINGDQMNELAPGSGAVYVFTRTADVWSQQAYIKASNTEADDIFGSSLALDGDTLAVAAYMEDSGASGINGDQTDNSSSASGAVYVFTRTAGIWSQQAYVKASTPGETDTFGFSLALYGDTLAVGATGEDSGAVGIDGNQADDTLSSAGAVYVFARSGDSWTQQAYVKASNTGTADLFGKSVSLSADTLAVGATLEDSNATGMNGDQANDLSYNSGAAYIYTRTGSIWSQQAYIKASNTGDSDQFGKVVLSGDTLAVGAYEEDSHATGIDGDQADNSAVGSGAVYMYTRTGGVWSQQAYIKASNTGEGHNFGYGIGLDGDSLAVGGLGEGSNTTGIDGDQANNLATDSGAVYLYTRTGDTWSQHEYIKASNTGEGDSFGYDVAFEGNTLVASGIFEDSSASGINGDQSNDLLSNSGAVYVFQPSVTLSTDADLSGLSLSNGTLTPTFDSATQSYTSTVTNAVASITVTPTVADANATITVNGTVVNSGSASSLINLSVGANQLTVVVTAEDGLSTNSYSISVTREATLSSDANLSALSLSAGTLAPVFDAGTNNYTATVINAVTSISITPTAADTSATITVNAVTVVSGVASDSVSLNVGSNTIAVEVTAEDGSTTDSYSISVTREAPPLSSDASLVGLTLSDGTLMPALDSGTFNYSAWVVYAVSSITVTPTTSDANASVTVNGVSVTSGTASSAVNLSVGGNAISVVVTAENGTTTNTYNIAVTREAASADALLSTLTLSEGALSPTFGSGGISYDVAVANAISSIMFTPTTSDNNATVTVEGVSVISTTASNPISLNVGSNLIEIVVTAENSSTNIYQVNVVREAAASSDADLSNLTLSAAGLDQFFQSSLLSYTVTVGYIHSTTTVTPTTSDINATVSVNGVTVLSGTASELIVLNEGSNIIMVEVSAEDGGTIRTYTITITREAATASNWQWANPLPQGNTIMDSTWNGSQFIAVGYYGTILTSLDGLSWTIGDAGTDANLYAIVWDGSQFIAVGTNGAIASSLDGTVWSVQHIDPSYTFYGIVWNGSQFVAVGQRETGDSGGFIATSSDGSTWVVQDHIQTGGYAWNDVAWNGSHFAAVQFPGFIHTSTDGINWATTDLSASNTNLQSIESDDGGRFVTVGFSTVYTSVDNGATWTLQSGGSSMRGSDLIWDGSQFMAAGFTDIFTSPDGMTWQRQYLSGTMPPATAFTTVCTNGSQYIVAGSTGVLINSPDSVTWTLQTEGEFLGLRDIIWDGTQFVAVGDDKTVRTSPDGMAWITRANTSGNWPYYSIAWSGDQFVAVGAGDSEQIATSPDGVTWTARTPTNSSLVLKGIVWGGVQFVAVGESGVIMNSPDGINWTVQTNGVTATDMYQDISWNGSLFVAVGSQNAAPYGAIVSTSSDGATWIAQELPWNQTVKSLTWDDNQFVAVGYQAILTSADGLTWVSRSSDMNSLEDVVWTGSQFVAVSQSPNIFISTDGVTWTSQRSISGYYSAIASDGNQVVVVSPFSQIVTNDAL